jgi:hypothetical protein
MISLDPADRLLEEVPRKIQPSQGGVNKEERLRDMMFILVIPSHSERQ